MTAFPFTVFRVHLVRNGQRFFESEFTALEAAAAHVAWLMRHNPRERITLDVVPPVRVPSSPVRPDTVLAAQEAALVASWERERGDSGEANPFLTLVQKRTQQHHDAVERACEAALQGGQYGVRVDVYPTRTEARVDPTVPYGRSVEHQHLTDPQEPR